MNQLERNQNILKKYIPEKAVVTIAQWVYEFDFKLKIKKSRSTKLGDYRSPYGESNHIITVNHDLNKYEFLITLVHEIAHLSTYNKHKNRVKPHGDEWKEEYKNLMEKFLHSEIFPTDVIHVLKNYMSNPAASSCSDINLLRIMKNYNEDAGTVLLENIQFGEKFIYNNSRTFIKGERVRKRIKCKEIETDRMYLFNPVTEVKPHPYPSPKEREEDAS